MSKGPFGVENPALYGTYPTTDGRWLITCFKDGRFTKLSGFLGSLEDAQAVTKVFNARELDGYKAESFARAVQMKVPGLKEIAEQLGVTFFDE